MLIHYSINVDSVYSGFHAMERLEHTWNERRSTTLRDVARDVGVSESTVSVVLNRTRSGTRVSDVTRRSVLEAAERLGYRPNGLARSLQTGSSNRIGIYSGWSRLDARNLFFAELLGGMFDGSLEHGMNTVVHTSGFESNHLLELVSNRAVDGLVLHARDNDPIIPMLDDLRVPVVAVADRVPFLPSVVVDDAEGGRLQAQHLAAKGHRHILYKQARVTSHSAAVRMGAFALEAELLGMRVTIHNHEVASEISDEDLALLRRKRERATAIVAWSDAMAEILCHRLADLGFSIPEDVAVAGFDGFRAFYAPRFDLTTVRAPWAEVGKTAVKMLNALIKGESVPSLTTLPVDFAPGRTT